ncbi:MAG: hypothetical protein ABIP30_08420 [Ferruginibacter sp.]
MIKSIFKIAIRTLIFLFTIIFVSSCKTYPDYLVFKKTNFEGKEIYDTIEAFPKRGLYIVSIEHRGFNGNFSWNLGIIKIDKKNSMNSIKYETKLQNKAFRISKDYVAYADVKASEWGWFCIKDRNFLDTLPLINKFIDSIKSILPKNVFLKEKNGYIEALINGKIIQRYSYGDFILKNNSVNFDSLDLGLYTIQKNNIVNISKNPDNLFNQEEGLFLVPYPGYKLLSKYSKEEILNAIEKTFETKIFAPLIIVKAIDE